MGETELSESVVEFRGSNAGGSSRLSHMGRSEKLRYCAKKMPISNSSRMLFSAALLCSFFLPAVFPAALPAARPAPAAFLPSLSQLQQLPLQFQKSLRALLGQKTAIVTYKGRPTTLAPRRPKPSSQQQHQQDLQSLLDYHPEAISGGEKKPERPKKPWGGLPSLSGQLVTVSSNSIVDDHREESQSDSLFREDVIGKPLHDKKINRARFGV